MKVIYEDDNILVVIKPAGLNSQASLGFEEDMISLIKKHLSCKNKDKSSKTQKGGSKFDKDLYVGLIHRLDKPVSGLMVFAKNKTAAAYLSKELAGHKIIKRYMAVVCGSLGKKTGQLVDFIAKDKKNSKALIVNENCKDGKKAVLNYKVLETKKVGNEIYNLIEVDLISGRFHQIRVQFASRNLPLLGDRKYGNFEQLSDNLSKVSADAAYIDFKNINIALACTYLKFNVSKKKELEFYEEPEESWYSLWKVL